MRLTKEMVTAYTHTYDQHFYQYVAKNTTGYQNVSDGGNLRLKKTSIHNGN